jgi:hypothetical protein
MSAGACRVNIQIIYAFVTLRKRKSKQTLSIFSLHCCSTTPFFSYSFTSTLPPAAAADSECW